MKSGERPYRRGGGELLGSYGDALLLGVHQPILVRRVLRGARRRVGSIVAGHAERGHVVTFAQGRMHEQAVVFAVWWECKCKSKEHPPGASRERTSTARG